MSLPPRSRSSVQSSPPSSGLPPDQAWADLRAGAEAMLAESGEDTCHFLETALTASLLRWKSLDEAMAAHLSGKVSTSPASPPEQWRCLLASLFSKGTAPNGALVLDLTRADLQKIKERDPACPSLTHAFLFYKGFHGLQLHRAANVLWRSGKRSLACLLQSIGSQVFGIDIHPAARIEGGLFIDHGTGVVIGETAVVGANCTILHGVTLGGTGKDTGDRHPKVGANVLIGAGASILGNVKIGDSAKIGAAALVLSDIPPKATAVGAPAKVVGRAAEADPASRMDSACRLVDVFHKSERALCPYRHLEGAKRGFLSPYEFAEGLKKQCKEIPAAEAFNLFFLMDKNNDGEVSAKEFEDNFEMLESMVRRYGGVDSMQAQA